VEADESEGEGLAVEGCGVAVAGAEVGGAERDVLPAQPATAPTAKPERRVRRSSGVTLRAYDDKRHRGPVRRQQSESLEWLRP
jgi:hypothetical protein